MACRTLLIVSEKFRKLGVVCPEGSVHRDSLQGKGNGLRWPTMTEAAPPTDLQAPRQPLGQQLLEVLLIGLVFFVMAGDPPPGVNEPHYLCRLKHFWNPGWCAGDLFLNVQSLSSVIVPNPTSVSSNYFTLNVGGGVMGFFTNHLGVRGDLRYYRAYGFSVADLQTAGTIALDHFDFWRASVALAAKF